MAGQDIRKILQNGGTILNAEGYMWEFGRRGYLKYGGFIPEVVLDHPDLVKSMHEEFVHAGSDVVQAFTYFGHREKLRSIGREDDVETLNRTALRIARKVADENGKIMAAGICNTGLFYPDKEETKEQARQMFKEQVEWAVEEKADFIIGETYSDSGEAMLALETIKEYGNGEMLFLSYAEDLNEQVEWAVEEKADFIIGETYSDSGEAMLALETIKEYGNGLPAVITMASYFPDITVNDIPFPEALRQLEEAGAAVVGLNCSRGPKSMLPLLREIRKVCKGPIAAIPVPFRCTDEYRTFHSLKDPETGRNLYPNDIESMRCNPTDIRQFGEEIRKIGVQYAGLCCGNCSALFRELAEAYGRKPPACKFSPDMTLSNVYGAPSGTRYGRADKIRAFMLNLKY